MNAEDTSYYTDYSADSTPEPVIKKEKTRLRTKRMANYKSKVNQLQTNVAQLLAKKKSLNSKVVSMEFEAFQQAVEKIQNDEGSALEVKQTLTGLEKALKKEGLFKNVKGLFVGMKKEFLSSPSTKPQPPLDLDALDDDDKRDSRSRVTTSVYSHRESSTKRYAATVHIEDVKSVNRQVGKLFGHLKVPKGTESKDTTMLSIQGRSSTIVKSKDFDETNFTDVIKRLKQFEKELNRQRATQHTELMRLADENQFLKKAMTDLRKEHDRMKGTQPITSKAKDKQVAKLEQQFRTQKKGMEGKISEIESELQISLEKTLQEKDVLEQLILDGVSRLKSAIITLHQKICLGDKDEREMGTILEKDEENADDALDEAQRNISVDELMKNITSIEDEARILQDRNDRLQQIISDKESEIHGLRTAISDISNEIGKMHGTVTNLDGVTPIKTARGTVSTSIKGLDSKEKELAIAKLQQVNASIQQYKRLLQEGSRSDLKKKDDLKPLRSQISKLYNDFKLDVERFDSEKSALSMDTLLDEPMQRDDLNIMMKKLTRIEKAYKVIKEKDADNKG